MSQLIAALTAFIALSNDVQVNDWKVGEQVLVSTAVGEQLSGQIDARSTSETIVLSLNTGSAKVRLPVAANQVVSIVKVATPTGSNLTHAQEAHLAIFGK